MGNVTAGVYATFKRMGIEEPTDALEMLAVTLAEALDKSPEDKTIAGISRELRLVLDQIELNHPITASDKVDSLAKQTN